ncbi:polyprenyl diphosphate synthase [Actinopolymorpha alba]|uniref:polyprenyl diphosphate synthase n=1 Tax=Actinopolymorpha alba TaxID=533267 RepID=UPI00035DD8E3|nr:polyprenyl diphosphate synthase [Actinopolymorpha alba]
MRLVKDAIYALYTRRLLRQLRGAPIPRHVAMVMDGNRRWARQMGFDNVSIGHRYGAEHIEEVLAWCSTVGIRQVTIFAASTDNLRKRASPEIAFLMEVIERAVTERLAHPSGDWRIQIAGRLDLLPDSTAHALKLAQDSTRDNDTDQLLTIAIGYDGREEIVAAVRSLLDQEARAGVAIEQLAEALSPEQIGRHLYTGDQPDPDLVIRTSGEVRMSGFLLWQAAFSELHFCDVYWPGFRYLDFLRALRSYADRQRARQ